LEGIDQGFEYSLSRRRKCIVELFDHRQKLSRINFAQNFVNHGYKVGTLFLLRLLRVFLCILVVIFELLDFDLRGGENGGGK